MNAIDVTRETPSVEERLWALECRVTRLRGIVEALLWAWIAVPLAVVLLLVKRPGGLMTSQVFNLGHVLLSAWVAWVAFRVSKNVLGTRRSIVHLAVAMGAASLLGGGLELAQLYAPGEPSWWDIMSDLGGGLAATLAIAASRGTPNRRARWFLWVGAGAVLLGSLAPSGGRILRELWRTRLFPTLATFDEAERDALELNGGATLRHMDAPSVADPALGARPALLTLPVSEFPGIEVTPPLGDWSAYAKLRLTVYSLAQVPTAFEVRVHDREHSRQMPPRSPRDRFSRSLLLHPGTNDVYIAIDDVRSTPGGRIMNLAEVEQVVLFAPSPQEPVQLLLGPWKLEGAVGKP